MAASSGRWKRAEPTPTALFSVSRSCLYLPKMEVAKCRVWHIYSCRHFSQAVWHFGYYIYKYPGARAQDTSHLAKAVTKGARSGDLATWHMAKKEREI